MEKILIVGLGVFGRALAENLVNKGCEVIAIDKNMELIEEVSEMVTYAVCLDSTDDKALDSIGLKDVDVAIVCIGEDFEATLMTFSIISSSRSNRSFPARPSRSI